MIRTRNFGTSDIDMGDEEIRKKLKRIKGAYVDAGYQGARTHKAAGGKSELTVTGLALVHEFGSKKRNIPERPFVRPAADRHQNEYRKEFRKILRRVLVDNRDLRRELQVFGELAASDIREEIDRVYKPELSLATIAARRVPSTKPLIDTGTMKASATSWVRTPNW